MRSGLGPIPAAAVLAATVWLAPGPAHAGAKVLFPVGIGGSISNITMPVDSDHCMCVLFSLPVGITHLDHFVARLNAAGSGSSGEVAIFSSDGATRYFHAAFTTTTAGNLDLANADTPTPMGIGDFWLCWSRASGGTYVLGGQNATNIRYARFEPACTGAVIPATLTSPTKTWATSTLKIPAFSLTDEQ